MGDLALSPGLAELVSARIGRLPKAQRDARLKALGGVPSEAADAAAVAPTMTR